MGFARRNRHSSVTDGGAGDRDRVCDRADFERDLAGNFPLRKFISPFSTGQGCRKKSIITLTVALFFELNFIYI